MKTAIILAIVGIATFASLSVTARLAALTYAELRAVHRALCDLRRRRAQYGEPADPEAAMLWLHDASVYAGVGDVLRWLGEELLTNDASTGPAASRPN